MSIGPLGILGSLAGAPLAQAKGSDVDKAAQDTVRHERQLQTNQKAENAAGIGQTQQDEQASDRDADGRRLWEQHAQDHDDPSAAGQSHDSESPQPKDPTGQRGSHLDLTG